MCCLEFARGYVLQLQGIIAKLFEMLTRFVIATLLLLSQASVAGVLNLPRFTPQGQLGFGIEPELTMTSGAGIGLQGRFQYGLGELTNIHLIVGNGLGPKLFRLGTAMAFDLFPDVEGQPGIGIAVQALYYRIPLGGRLDATLVPYIQKTIQGLDTDFTPYAAIPFGMAFSDLGGPSGISQFVFGSRFKLSERFHYIIELGMGITSSDTYIATGLMIYP